MPKTEISRLQRYIRNHFGITLDDAVWEAYLAMIDELSFAERFRLCLSILTRESYRRRKADKEYTRRIFQGERIRREMSTVNPVEYIIDRAARFITPVVERLIRFLRGQKRR